MKDSISIFVQTASDRENTTNISRGTQLVRVPPDANEPLDGPSHQIRNLSIADLYDTVDAVCPARHVNTEERARNRLCAKCQWFRNGLARLGGIRRSIQDEVSPLGASNEILDAPDAKTSLDKTSILLHFRNHCFDLLRVFDDGANRGLQGFDIVFDEELLPSEAPQLGRQIGVGVEEDSLRRIIFDEWIPVRQVVCRQVVLWRCDAKAASPFDRCGEVHVLAVSEHPAAIDHTRPELKRRPNAGGA